MDKNYLILAGVVLAAVFVYFYWRVLVKLAILLGSFYALYHLWQKTAFSNNTKLIGTVIIVVFLLVLSYRRSSSGMGGSSGGSLGSGGSTSSSNGLPKYVCTTCFNKGEIRCPFCDSYNFPGSPFRRTCANCGGSRYVRCPRLCQSS